MSRISTSLWTAVLLLAWTAAWTDDEEFPPSAAEATIRLMDEADAELPDAVMNEIELPELPQSSRGNEGIATASENTGRRDVGQNVAEGVLDNARENANSMAEDALENVEQRGRSEEHRPDDVPGPKGPPGSPGP